MHHFKPNAEPWQIAQCEQIMRENPGIEKDLDDFGLFSEAFLSAGIVKASYNKSRERYPRDDRDSQDGAGHDRTRRNLHSRALWRAQSQPESGIIFTMTAEHYPGAVDRRTPGAGQHAAAERRRVDD